MTTLLIMGVIGAAITFYLAYSLSPFATRVRGVVKAKKDEIRYNIGSMKDEATERIAQAKKDGIKFRKEIADAKAELKKLDKKVDSANKDVVKWTNIAKKIATTTKNAVDLQEADRNVQEAKKKWVSYSEQYRKTGDIIRGLEKQLREHDDKVAQTESQVEILEAREKGVKLQKKALETSKSFSVNPNDGLDAFEEHIVQQEFLVAAMADLVTPETSHLEDKYSAPQSENLLETYGGQKEVSPTYETQSHDSSPSYDSGSSYDSSGDSSSSMD